jgi:hypothetical protein
MRFLKCDVPVILILPVLAAGITIGFKTDLFISNLLFFGLPSAFIAFRNPSILRKSLTFAFCLSAPLSFFVDVLAAINGAWIVPHSIFPWKFFGVATIEVYIFGFLWVLYAILFYEHFYDGGKSKDKTFSRIFYLVFFSVALVCYVTIGFLFSNRLLHIPHFYLITGLILVVIPFGLFLLRYPLPFRKLLGTGIYFAFLLCLFEIAALVTGQWIFPGSDFVGIVVLWGYRVPIEEFVIWIGLATISLLTYYEVFADDRC